MAKVKGNELFDYLNVKSAKIVDKEEGSAEQSGAAVVGGKVYKHWTTLWVVLHTQKSPTFSFIGSCKKEADWLSNNKIEKIYLGDSFEVEKQPEDYSKKHSHVLQIAFKTYRLDLAFDSLTKMEVWYKALRAVTECYHVDLVRCPEYADLEGEYIMEVTPECFRAWTFRQDRECQSRWEWQLKQLRRVHWHKNVHKLEVEPGRSSQTGEGHFYFTGKHAARLFSIMRQRMTKTSTSSNSSLPSKTERPSDLSPRISTDHRNPMYHKVNIERLGVESEDDWTGGTGDNTSDSGFFVGRVPRPVEGRNHFILPAGPAPPLPKPNKPSQGTEYADINIKTMNPDSQYVQITRRRDQVHVYDSVPAEPYYSVPRPIDVDSGRLGTRLPSITDDYCQMGSVSICRDIRRNGSLPMERPPPVPAHQVTARPPTAWADSNGHY